MQSNGKIICNSFELEVWFYMGNDLSDEKMEFWRNHLRGCSACKRMLNETEEIVSVIENDEADIDDTKYNRMVEKAVKKRRFSLLDRISYLTKKQKEKFVLVGKIALVSGLAVVAVIVSLLSEQPNAVKKASNELLDWEGKIISAQINDVKNHIFLIKDDEWGIEINLIDQRIDQLEKNSDPFSFE